MVRIYLFVAVILFIGVATHSSLALTLADHHPLVRQAWTEVTSVVPSPSTLHTLTFALKQRNLDKLEALFWEVSDPDHPSYANYLTPEDISSIIAPPREDVRRLTTYLSSRGGKNIRLSRSGDVVKATFRIADIEQLFGVTMRVFRHASGHMVLRSTKRVESFPGPLAALLDLVHGLHDFPPRMRSRRTASREELRVPRGDVASFEPGVRLLGVKSRGNGSGAVVTLVPVCLNGSLSSNANCDGEIQSYIFKASYPQENINLNTFHTPSDLTCSQASGSFTCTFTLTITTVFSSGAQFTASFEYPFVGTSPIVPQSLISLYNIDKKYQAPTSAFKQCVVEFEQQYYSPADLSKFFELMGVDGNNTRVDVIGPNDASNPGGEANLDIQWMMAVAPRIETVFWSIPANSTEEIDDILTWAYEIANMTDPPIVNSLSYGMVAKNVDTYLGKGYLARSDVEFQKLALMGLTVIIADGDNGAGDLGDPPMLTPSCSTELNPDWPSQSPYVTAVGSTYATPLSIPLCYLPLEQGGIDCLRNHIPLGEVSVSIDNGIFWTTGGGFANEQQRPKYQDDFVSRYLANPSVNLPPKSFFNANGRAYPDVSAIGHNLMTVLNGTVIPVDGTSASAPIFGGIVSLLNTARVQAGKPVLGFLNPLLYKIARMTPDAFNDVVIGNNRCSAYSNDPLAPYGPCCDIGYSATVGWDPISGLGTPNFAVLVQEVLKY